MEQVMMHYKLIEYTALLNQNILLANTFSCQKVCF